MFLTEEIVFYIGTQINENERTLSQQQIYFEKTNVCNFTNKI